MYQRQSEHVSAICRLGMEVEVHVAEQLTHLTLYEQNLRSESTSEAKREEATYWWLMTDQISSSDWNHQ